MGGPADAAADGVQPRDAAAYQEQAYWDGRFRVEKSYDWLYVCGGVAGGLGGPGAPSPLPGRLSPWSPPHPRRCTAVAAAPPVLPPPPPPSP